LALPKGYVLSGEAAGSPKKRPFERECGQAGTAEDYLLPQKEDSIQGQSSPDLILNCGQLFQQSHHVNSYYHCSITTNLSRRSSLSSETNTLRNRTIVIVSIMIRHIFMISDARTPRPLRTVLISASQPGACPDKAYL
jgi:hypothetical protein